MILLKHVKSMGKFRLGGYIFITWIGDHEPKHVHIFRDGKLVLKWNLEDSLVMKGKITSNLRKLIDKLQAKGKI